MLKKIGIILSLFFIGIALVWSLGQIGLDISGKKITVNMWDNGLNPYLFSEKTRKLQEKLNKALSFNLKEYQRIAENGFYDQATKEALEKFRDMYFKKYNLQRYYAFSAGETAEPSDWEKQIDREAPSPATFLNENREKQNIKLGDPSKFYGNSGTAEIQRIEKGLNGDYVNPVNGELSKTVMLYSTPAGNDHLMPIQLAGKYSAQMTSDAGMGFGWYLTENYSLWYSYEKNEVVIQDGSGMSQEYSWENNAFHVKGADKTGGFFQSVTLSGGTFGLEGSQIQVKTKKGDTLTYTCHVSGGGDTVRKVMDEADKSAVIRGYSIEPNEYYIATNINTTYTDIKTTYTDIKTTYQGTYQGYNSVTVTNFASARSTTNFVRLKRGPIEVGVMGTMFNFGNTNKQTATIGDYKGRFLEDAAAHLKDGTESGFSVSFWAEKRSDTNTGVFNFSQRGTTNKAPDQFAGYQLEKTQNRYGAYKTYTYDPDGKLQAVSSYSPNDIPVDTASISYAGNTVINIGWTGGTAALGYQSNDSKSCLSNITIRGDLPQTEYNMTYEEYLAGNNFDSNITAMKIKLNDSKTNLEKALKDINGSISSTSGIEADKEYKSGDKAYSYTIDYRNYMLGRLSDSRDQILTNLMMISNQIQDLNDGKMIKRVMAMSEYSVQTAGLKNSSKYEYKSMDMRSFNSTNSENAIRLDTAHTAAGMARFDYSAGNTVYTDPLGNSFAFSVDNDAAKAMADRRIKGITYPDRSAVGFIFDTNGNILHFVNENQDSYDYTYDANGNVTKKTLPDTRQWTFEYGNPAAQCLGQPTRIVQPDGSVYEMTYNEYGDLTKQTLAGHILAAVSYVYTPGQGYTKTSVDQYGSPTVYRYDAGHNLISATQPDGTATTFQNDVFGKPTNRTTLGAASGIPAAAAPGPVTFYTVYDSRGNALSQGIQGKTASTAVYDGLGRKLSETDALGNKAGYSYDAAGRLAQMTLPDGALIKFGYDANNNKALEDYGNWKIGYAYSPKNEMVKKTQYDNGASYETVLSYDSAGNMVMQTMNGRGWGADSPKLESRLGVTGAVVSNGYGYDKAGMLTSETNYLTGAVLTYSYDKLGRLTNETHTMGNKTVVKNYSYDYQGRKTLAQARKDGAAADLESAVYNDNRSVAKTDAYGNVSTTYYDFRNAVTNLAYSVFNPLTGQNEAVNHGYIYDGFGNKVKEIYPDGTTQEWSYENGGWLTGESRRRLPGEPPVWKTYVNDSRGRPLKASDFNGNTWTMAYDYHGQITTNTDPMGRTTVCKYDVLGNRIEEISGPGDTRTDYNLFKKPVRVTYSDGTVIRMGYDALGNMSWKQSGSYTPEFYAYRDDGKLASALSPSGMLVKNSYDSVGNLTGTLRYGSAEPTQGPIPASRNWNYTYDAYNRLTSETDPLGHTVRHSYGITPFGTLVETVSNGAASDVRAAAAPNPVLGNGSMTSEIVYDQMNREIRRTVADKTLTSSSGYPFYSGSGIVSGKVFNAAGLPVIGISPGGRAENYQYSPSGKIVKETNPIGEAKTIVYDDNGNMTSMTDFDGNTYSYQYDKSGKMSASANPDGGQTLYVYGADGSLSQKTMPGGAVWKYEVNGRGLTVKETNPFGGTASYEYDALGNRITETRPDGSVFKYGCDGAGRLSEIRTPGSSANGKDFVTSVSYTGFGETNRIVYPDKGAEEYTYDRNGRTIGKKRGQLNSSGAFTGTELIYIYNYTPEGYLSGAAFPGGLTEAYEYNAAGLMVKKYDITNGVKCRETVYGYTPATSTPLSDRSPGAYGQVEWSTDYRGVTTASFYDAAGRVTNRTLASGSSEGSVGTKSTITSYGLEQLGNLRTRTVTSWQESMSSQGATVTENYQKDYKDFRGITVQTMKRFGGSTVTTFRRNVKLSGMTEWEKSLQDRDKNTWLETDYAYDGKGLLLSRADPSGLVTTYTYDNMGRVTLKNESGRSTAMTYYPNGPVRTSDTAGLETAGYEYDFRGNAVSKTDMKSGTVSKTLYDAFGNKTEESVSWNGTTAGKRYVYDEAGRLKRTVNETGGVTEYDYDILGQKTVERSGPSIVRSLDSAAKQGVVNSGTSAEAVDSGTGPWIKTETYQYDAAGNMTGRTVKSPQPPLERGSYTYRYEYDGWGNRTKTVYPDNSTETARYDAWGRRTSGTDRFGYASAMAYDGNGRLTSETGETAAGKTLSAYLYDTAGNKIDEKTGPSGSAQGPAREYTYEYNARGFLAREGALAEKGFIYKNTEYDVFGNKTAVVDFEGNRSSAVYDALGRVVRTTSAGGRITENSYGYDGNGRSVTSVQNYLDGKPVVTKSYADGFGQTVETVDALGKSEKTAYTITADGREVLTTDRRGNSTLRKFDAFGRLVSTTDCYGKVLSNEYDGFGNIIKVTDKNNKVLTRDYDWQNRVVKTTDALGNAASYRYTLGHWEDKACEINETIDAEGNTATSYLYGKQTLAIVDAMGGITAYQYDIYGNLVATKDAKGNINKLTYDLRGNITSRVTALGFTTAYQYDNSGRQIYENNSVDWIKTTYDADGNVQSKNYKDGNTKTFNYDSLGRLIESKDNNSDYSYSYDLNGNLLSKNDLKNKDNISYNYDENGNRMKMTAGSKIVTYLYDGLNQVIQETALTTRTSGPISTNLVVVYAYDAMQRVTNKQFSSGLRSTYQYDDIYRLTKIVNYTNASASLGGQLFSTLEYIYDKVGNRVSETELVPSVQSSAAASDHSGTDVKKRISTFSYDKDYRLISADYGNGQRESFTYDATGNRLTKTSVMNGKTEVTKNVYDNDNRLMCEQYDDGSINRYTYDAAGRIIKKEHGDKAERYTYNSRDLMIEYSLTEGSSLTITKYTYDVENLRVSKSGTINRVEVQKKGTFYYEVPMSADYVRYTYDGQNILTEGSANAVTSFYLNNIEINSYEAEIQPLNTAVYIKDAIGSVRGELYTRPLTTAKSEVLTHRVFEYTAFGETLTPDPSPAEASEGGKTSKVKDGIGYTGHFGDTESNLYYARARFYDPTNGRFLTRDSNISDVTPAGLDRYVYGLNNPTRYTDPDGKIVYEAALAIIGGTIGFFNAAITNLGDLASGNMSALEYIANLGLGTVSGIASMEMTGHGIPVYVSVSTRGYSAGVGYSIGGAVNVGAGVHGKWDGTNTGLSVNAGLGDKTGANIGFSAGVDFDQNGKASYSAGLSGGIGGFNVGANLSFDSTGSYNGMGLTGGFNAQAQGSNYSMGLNGGVNFDRNGGYLGGSAGMSMSYRDVDHNTLHSEAMGVNFDRNGNVTFYGNYSATKYVYMTQQTEVTKTASLNGQDVGEKPALYSGSQGVSGGLYADASDSDQYNSATAKINPQGNSRIKGDGVSGMYSMQSSIDNRTVVLDEQTELDKGMINTTTVTDEDAMKAGYKNVREMIQETYGNGSKVVGLLKTPGGMILPIRLQSGQVNAVSPLDDPIFIIAGSGAVVKVVGNAVIQSFEKRALQQIAKNLEVAGSKKAFVIGEGMDYIKVAAKELQEQGVNAKWYQAWSKNFPKDEFGRPIPMTPAQIEAAQARNARIITDKVNQGYDIYDIGPDGRLFSPFYQDTEIRILKEFKYPTIPYPRPKF